VSTPRRVVSLLPAATEIVCALGAGERLVGRSHECDFPLDVRTLPVCSRPRSPMGGSGATVDRQVREIIGQGLSVFEVLAERLQELKPDLVVTQVQCEVCAVSLAEVEAALCEWTGEQPRIVTLEPAALRDVMADVQGIADALDLGAEGARLRAAMRQRMRDIDGAANGLPGAPTVVCVEWIEPLMVAGNWVPELVDLAGGNDRLGRAGAHSPCVAWQQVLDEDPDVLLVMPCGFDLPRACREAATLETLPGFAELSCVQTGELYAVDGHQFFNRPGPRLVESLEILAEIFHPERFHFGHEGTGWRRLDGTPG